MGAPTEASLLVLAEKVGLADAAATAAARKKRTNTPEEHPQPITNVSARGRGRGWRLAPRSVRAGRGTPKVWARRAGACVGHNHQDKLTSLCKLRCQ